MRRQRSKIATDRITEARWDARADEGMRGGGFSGFIFMRDALLGLVPIGGRSYYRKGFRIRLEDDSDETRELVIGLFGGDRYDLTESVCDFVEEIGRHLAQFGEIVFELVRPNPEPDSIEGNQPPPIPVLEVVPALTLKRLGPLVIQVIPRVARSRRFQFVRVPAAKLFRITLPPELGTPRQHRRMLRRLARVERATRLLNPSDFPKGYDFDAARRANDAETIRLSGRWGVLPFMRPQNMTSYFEVAGTIAHQRVQALVREHVIEKLNDLLVQQGLPKLVVEDLPTADAIRKTLAALAEGDVDLVQASDRTRW